MKAQTTNDKIKRTEKSQKIINKSRKKKIINLRFDIENIFQPIAKCLVSVHTRHKTDASPLKNLFTKQNNKITVSDNGQKTVTMRKKIEDKKYEKGNNYRELITEPIRKIKAGSCGTEIDNHKVMSKTKRRSGYGKDSAPINNCKCPISLRTIPKQTSIQESQHPLSNLMLLTIRLLFLCGWSFFYFFLYRMYTVIIFPGRTYQGNIYAYTIFTIILTVAYSYFFYHFFRIIFIKNKPLKARIIALAGSVLCAWIAFLMFAIIYELPILSDSSYNAFWATY